MYLQKNLKNKYTVGKQLRRLKGLRKKDPHAIQTDMPAELKEYLTEL